MAAKRSGPSSRTPDNSRAEFIDPSFITKTALAVAIAAGEFIPYVQPIIRLGSEQTVGFEVLARWRHPTLGLVQPAAFIPAIEEHGLGAALAMFLLKTVFTAESDGMPYSFNINPDGLSRLLQDVERNAPPSWDLGRIVFEVTETQQPADFATFEIAANRCLSLGIRLSLDDFGAGYAHLGYLRAIHFTSLKIDRSLTSDLPTQPLAKACVTTIIDLARSLKITVIVEGVETRACASILKNLGADYAQGYYFARPRPFPG